MNDYPERKHNRLRQFDYNTIASYFITICTARRDKIFWSGTCDDSLSAAGLIVDEEIRNLPERFDQVKIDKYVIMPDHVHLIISINGMTSKYHEKLPDIKNAVGCLKSKVTIRIGSGESVWQKSFYDHIIRDDNDYNGVWYYIETNPAKYLNPSGWTNTSVPGFMKLQ